MPFEKDEAVDYPSDEIKAILERTLGVPLFQQQAMEIAIVAAGFTPAEADLLRRSMTTFKFNGLVTKFEQKLVTGMTDRSHTKDFAQRIFKQLEGSGSYGFPESHAASFALLIYFSCWLKHYYPDVFAAALLNSQLMGFYQPAQIIRNAQEHGVQILPIDVNRSSWDNTLEEKNGKFKALRLGFREIKGIREEEMQLLTTGRTNYEDQEYTATNQLCDAGVSVATLERLANADAFRSMGMDRRQALWEVSALSDRPVEAFEGQPSESEIEPRVQLPLMRPSEHVIQDHATTGLSIKGHPTSFVRERLSLFNIRTSKQLENCEDGQIIKVAVLVRQRPGTAGGVCFITIEDETGTSNLVVFPKLFDKFRKEIQHARLLMVEGKIQKTETIHVIVQRCFDYTKLLGSLTNISNDQQPVLTLSRADEKASPFVPVDKRTQVRAKAAEDYLDKGRNFK